MNLLEQFAYNLEFLGLGTVANEEHDGNIHWGVMPDQPDLCVGVFSTDSGFGGSDDGARIQVMVRARSAKAAYELSQSIVKALVDFDGFLNGDGARASIDVINASAGLGADTKKREIYSSNFLVHYCDY